MYLSNVCVFCGSSEFISFKAQNFEYQQCVECSSIELVDGKVPNYDKDYYSFSNFNYKLNLVELFFIKIKSTFTYPLYPLLSGFTRRGLGPWIGKLSKGQVWLDYGAGNGVLTQVCEGYLKSDNYFYDPYANSTSVSFIQEFLEAHNAKFDLITMSHCLEHSFNPSDEIQRVSNLLANEGELVVRIPVWNIFWGEKRRESWIQLDPPFHRHIPSVDGMRQLLNVNGFIISNEIYDGLEFPWVNSFHVLEKITRYKFLKYLIRLAQGLLNYAKFSDQVVIIAHKKK